MTAENGKTSVQRRLGSWKEIAAFLGRDERTAKRWEDSRGLPVRRIPGAGRSSVFAFTDEIEAWMRAGAPATASPEPVADAEKRDYRTWTRQHRYLVIAFAALIIVAAAGLFVAGEKGVRSSGRRDINRPDPAAAEYYRSGLHAWQTRTPAGIERAIGAFKHAVSQDPNFAAAYSGLADAYNLEAEYSATPAREAYPRAEDAAKRAIALDPSLASAHAALAFDDFYWSRNTKGAAQEFRRALALDPSNATTHHWYATFLMTLNQPDAALAQIEKAENLDSESSAIPADKALILFHAGRIAEAVKLLTQLEDEQPDFASPHRYLATIWFDENNDSAYLRELKLAARSRGDASDSTIADAGMAGLTRAGHGGMLRAILSVQRDLFRQGKGSAYALAITSAKLGDMEQAISYLSTSLARRETENIALAVEPPLVNLKGDSRFTTLLAQAGLSQHP